MGLFGRKKATLVQAAASDDRFAALSASSQRHLRAGELGLYRNDLFNMAAIAEKEGRHGDALRLLCWVCCIDSFGYSSLEAYHFSLQDGAKAWPPDILIAPGVVSRIGSIAAALGMEREALRVFIIENVRPSMLPEQVVSVPELADAILLYLDGKREKADKAVRSFERRYIKSHPKPAK